jgi:hypothetical protein
MSLRHDESVERKRRQSSSATFGALLTTPVSKRIASPPVVLIICYLLVRIGLSIRLGLVTNLPEVVFSTPDAQEHRTLLDVIIGKVDQVPREILEVRPILFPLFLSIHNLIGLTGYVLLQLGLSLASLWLVFTSVVKVTGSAFWGNTAMGLMGANLTFSFISPHAPSQSLSIVLVAGARCFILSHRKGRRLGRFSHACFLLAALPAWAVMYPYLGHLFSPTSRAQRSTTEPAS